MRLSAIPLPFLLCRDIKHAWDENTAEIETDSTDGTVYRTLWCRRCDTRRIEVFSSKDLTVLRRWYAYPKGYLQPTALDRTEVRRITLKALALRLAKKKGTS